MWAILIPLRAGLNTASWLSMPEGALAAGDQFRAMARDSSRWLLNHHCPMPDLAVPLPGAPFHAWCWPMSSRRRLRVRGGWTGPPSPWRSTATGSCWSSSCP